MSASELSRLDELISRYLDGELAEAEAAELLALLAEPSLAARFLEIARLNSEIAGILAAPVPEEAMVELVRADIERSIANLPERRADILSAGSSGNLPHEAQGTDAPPIGRLEDCPTFLNTSAMRAKVPASRSVSGKHRPVWSVKWAAAFLVLAGIAAIILLNRTNFGNAPVLASAQGEVRLTGPAGERRPRPGDAWQENERLKTIGPNSAVTLMLRDGSQLDFSNGAIAVNQPSVHGCRVTLEHGVLQAAVQKHSVSAPFVFVTAEAEARVVGTKLRLVASLHWTRLEVSEGEVVFRRRHDDKEITVKSGEYAVVAPNVPFLVRPIHADPHHGK